MKTENYANHPGVKAHPDNLPQHVAIIMDGNGRWASIRKMSRTLGHRKGVEAARDIIFASQDKGIKALTLFAFGLENWKRPSKEVRNLFRIFFLVLRKDIRRLHEKNIRLRIIGDREFFTDALHRAVTDAETLTQENTGLQLNIAVNYSGRWDLLQAFQNASKMNDFSENAIKNALSLKGMPEPDLFIRTGGVKRISNFMLWELAYTELYFSNTLWPDFTVNDYEHAIQDFAERERRFGLTSEQLG